MEDVVEDVGEAEEVRAGCIDRGSGGPGIVAPARFHFIGCVDRRRDETRREETMFAYVVWG